MLHRVTDNVIDKYIFHSESIFDYPLWEKTECLPPTLNISLVILIIRSFYDDNIKEFLLRCYETMYNEEIIIVISNHLSFSQEDNLLSLAYLRLASCMFLHKLLPFCDWNSNIYWYCITFLFFFSRYRSTSRDYLKLILINCVLIWKLNK